MRLWRRWDSSRLQNAGVPDQHDATPPRRVSLVEPVSSERPNSWEHLSRFIQAGYTMNGSIAVFPWYFDHP